MEALLQIVGGIGGLVLLYYGAEFLVRGGVQIAKRFQVTPLVIGLTLVAFATSAPELVVSCDAALKGMGDIALGNVIGSNICNIALILGLCAVIAPLQVNASLFKLDLPLMIGSSVLFALFCFLTGGINRIEGALFFAGIIAYVVVSIRNARRSGDVVTEVEGDGTKSLIDGLTSWASTGNGGSTDDNGRMARMVNPFNLTIEGIGEDASIYG